MKKALITLLTMAGIAIAGNSADFEQELTRKVQQSGYETDYPYTVSLILSHVPENGDALRLGDEYYLVNQWHRHWGFNRTADNEITDSKNYTHEVNNNIHTYTSQPGSIPLFWVKNDEGRASGKRLAGNQVYITITGNGTDTTITIDYELCPITDTLVLKKTVLNPAQFRVNDKAEIVRHTIEIEKPEANYTTPIGLLIGTLGICGLIVAGQRSRRKNAD